MYGDKTISGSRENEALLDDFEQFFGEQTETVRFREPVRAVDTVDLTKPKNIEYARPIRTKLSRTARAVRFCAMTLVLGYGGYLGYNIWYGNSDISKPVLAQSVASERSEAVIEDTVSKRDIQRHTAASSQPKRVQIGQETHAKVQARGLADNAKLVTAKNTNDIAWYNGSAAPGRAGVSVMVGTLAGPTGTSNLAASAKVAVGDKVTVTMGDDSAVFYRITSVTPLKDIGDMSAFMSHGSTPSVLKVVLRDKVKQTADAGSNNVVIVGELFQDPVVKFKPLRRW